MTIEEKAKAYDEAKLRISSAYNSNRCTIGFMNEIFPELKESEDERIRKTISDILLIDSDEIRKILVANNILMQDIDAWLEKQGDIIENNMLLPFKEYDNLMDSINKKKKEGYEAGYKQGLIDSKNDQHVQPKFKVGDTIRVKNSSAEYVITDIYGGCYHGKGWGLDIISADRSGDYELVEQKPTAWSEEDKGNLLHVKCIIDEVWHNQEVREEIDHSGEELESLWNWLDGIWQRVNYPQSQWKPSDEQIGTLEQWLRDNRYKGDARTCYPIFDSLYEQLKKLKEG